MKRNVVFLGVACALALSGCTSTMLRNTAELLCDPRMHCYQGNGSGDAVPAAANTSEHDSVDSWEAQTLKRIDAIADK